MAWGKRVKNFVKKKYRSLQNLSPNWQTRRRIARRWRWLSRDVFTWPWRLLAIALVGLWWLDVWGMLGPVFDRLQTAFEAVEDIEFETLTASGKVEAFRNLLWGLSIAAGAAVAAITLGFSAWRTAMETRRVNVERRKAETETFATAIDHLDGGDLAKRLGAIRNLETLAAESPRLHPPIVETFCAYLREKSRARLNQNAQPWSSREFPADLQMIVTALGRRDVHQDTPGYHLDLSEADLDGANFDKGDFKGTKFQGASMKGCHFEDAHLEGADLWNAHLERAYIMDAHLERAYLRRAHLERAYLMDAHLEGANLRGAHLERAYVRRAHLERAYLKYAHLERADLVGAHLEGADLRGAQFEGANLKKTQNLTQEQLECASGDSNTLLPDGLTRPSHWQDS